MKCLPSGPINAKIAIVGESPNKDDVEAGTPFNGSAGKELTRMLKDAGINRDECYLTTVFQDKAPGGKIEGFCGKKAEVGGKEYTLPPLRAGKYFKPEYLHEIDRLKTELTAVAPNIVIALGAAACWALLSSGKITSLRGVVTTSTLIPELKVLPTFNPANVLKVWSNRPVTVLDLMKAAGEADSPIITRIRRELWIEPDIADLWDFLPFLQAAEVIGVDIETANKIITSIGFSSSKTKAINIPFWDSRKAGGSYWKSAAMECLAWVFVRHILKLPNIKVMQNGMYDVQYLWKTMGMPVINFTEDTMLLHHALQPELQKGLGFLGSVYTNEAAWKEMRKPSNKKDE
mgnify:CR=1 FL=1